MTHIAHRVGHNFRAVPMTQVIDDLKNHTQVLKQLTEGVELLTRQRGNKGTWAVTFTDLVNLGLITEEQANEYIASRQRG